MIFCSLSLKYPFGFHQLVVLVGHAGIKKNDMHPIRKVNIPLYDVSIIDVYTVKKVHTQ
jgi:hypothetical protein